MKNKIENNIQQNICIPKETMIGYVNNTLDQKSFLNVSSHLEGCEYCAEAFNGLKQMGDFTALNSLPALWQKRTGIKSSSNSSFTISKITWSVISLVVIVCGVLFFNKINPAGQEQNSVNKPENLLFGLNAPPNDENKINKSESHVKKGSPKSILEKPGEIKEDQIEIPNKIPEREAFSLSINYSPEIKIPKNYKSSLSEIIYLENLKTIDYSKKYSKSQSRLEDILNSVSSQYENKEQQIKKQTETQKNTYAISYKRALSNGLRNYSRGLYQPAINDFDIILKQFPKDLNCKFYKALCYESTGRFPEAEKLFSETMTDEDGCFFEEAKWHLATTKIKLEEITEAKNILKQIISDNGFYKSKADAMLKELK